jgi:hypothetical protein
VSKKLQVECREIEDKDMEGTDAKDCTGLW